MLKTVVGSTVNECFAAQHIYKVSAIWSSWWRRWQYGRPSYGSELLWTQSMAGSFYGTTDSLLERWKQVAHDTDTCEYCTDGAGVICLRAVYAVLN